MKKSLSLVFVAAFVVLFAGCGRDVPSDTKPIIGSALSGEFGVPARCLEVKYVKKVEGEKDSFTAVAVCDIGGREQSGGITIRYKDDKPVVGIIGFGYPEIMTVKRGILKFDESRNVATALSANLKNLKWEKYRNRKNQTIVKASGIWKGETLCQKIASFTSCIVSAGNDGFIFVKPGKNVEAYFLVNPDRSFSFVTAKIFGTENDLGFVDGKGEKVVTGESFSFEYINGGILNVLYY